MLELLSGAKHPPNELRRNSNTVFKVLFECEVKCGCFLTCLDSSEFSSEFSPGDDDESPGLYARLILSDFHLFLSDSALNHSHVAD